MKPMPISEVVGANQAATSDLTAETERIRSAYAKRRSGSVYSMFDPAQMLAVQERERKLLKRLAACGFHSTLERARILEIGCGTGFWLREFIRWGARPENIVGIDLLPQRIASAQSLCPSGVTLSCQSATDLHNLPCSFDLVLQSTVFTSILEPQMKRRIANEMLRVLSPGGLIVWYDFHMSNPANPDVHGIKREEIKELFPGCHIQLERMTLAPPLGRPIARISPTLYRAAAAIKLLSTHYLGLIRKL